MDGMGNAQTGAMTDIMYDVLSFPGFSECGNFHTGILIGIFTMKFADGRMDVTDDEHTVSQMVVLVTSQVGWQTDESCN